MTLRRTVRLCVNPGDDPHAPPKGPNGFAGTPPMRGLGRYFEFDVTVTGEPDERSGYLVDIKTIDKAVRRAVYPRVATLCAESPDREPAAALPDLVEPLAEALAPHRLRSIVWRLTPTYSVAMEIPPMSQTNMLGNDAPKRVLIRQRFDFAAAHRLHVEGVSDEDNRAMFGKCNNPSGHGHNYQVEPCVAIDPATEQGQGFSLAQLEALTDEVVIDHFDHLHLNVDTEEFGPSGVNPSVENIARVAFERLAPAIAGAGAELVSMTVWETDRTSCTYPA